jgi:hypothetical protein
LQAIQGLTITEENYKSAVEILHHRFGKTQQVIAYTFGDDRVTKQRCHEVKIKLEARPENLEISALKDMLAPLDKARCGGPSTLNHLGSRMRRWG